MGAHLRAAYGGMGYKQLFGCLGRRKKAVVVSSIKVVENWVKQYGSTSASSSSAPVAAKGKAKATAKGKANATAKAQAKAAGSAPTIPKAINATKKAKEKYCGKLAHANQVLTSLQTDGA